MNQHVAEEFRFFISKAKLIGAVDILVDRDQFEELVENALDMHRQLEDAPKDQSGEVAELEDEVRLLEKDVDLLQARLEERDAEIKALRC